MKFNPNKTPIEVVKEGAFVRNIFQGYLFWCYWKVAQKNMERIRSFERR